MVSYINASLSLVFTSFEEQGLAHIQAGEEQGFTST